jgi:hypothetical protein
VSGAVSAAGNGRHPLLTALEPVAAAIGAEVVGPDDRAPSDIPLEWDGRVVGAMRILPLQGALGRMIEGVERELGAPLGQLGREDKQRAVRRLEERGAFVLRRSVEDVADALDVSRITVYNYLNAMREEPARRS